MNKLIPHISKEQSAIKLVLNSGEVFFAHDVLPEYRYDHRKSVLNGLGSYFKEARPTPESDAYCVLMWHLFPDYLNAYTFRWMGKPKAEDKKKHLYVVRNSNGFIKVGVTSNVAARIIDLKYEFDGEWEIIKVYNHAGAMEFKLHGRLMEYIFPVVKRHTGRLSRECFIDCPEVLTLCEQMGEEIHRKNTHAKP